MAQNHTAPGNIRGLSSSLTEDVAHLQRSEPRVRITSRSTPFSSLYADTNTTGENTEQEKTQAAS